MQKSAGCYERTPTLVSLGNKFVILWTISDHGQWIGILDDWPSGVGSVELQVEEKLYPPRFQVAVGGNITENVLATFSFKGTTENLNAEVLLKTDTLGITLWSLIK